MGLEGELFIGNPNKVEYTDDELEDEEVGPDLWLEPEQDQIPDEDDPWEGQHLDHDENWVMEREAVRDFLLDYSAENPNSDDDDDNDDEIEQYVDYLSDADSNYDDELRLALVNGALVQVGGRTSPFQPRPEASASASASGVVNDIDNNEVVKPVTEVAQPEASDEGDAVVPVPRT